ncbi:hypothetical protein CFP56_030258 [Quercus suber]|uniref:Uncharacterized protein n=1 Tax=Quercus suber TaxID=58331 RepID=A0AAW0LWM3_QUESU
MVVYEYKSDQKREVNYIATKVEKDQEYKNVFKYRFYPNTASSQIVLSRNFIIHINDDGKCVSAYLRLRLRPRRSIMKETRKTRVDEYAALGNVVMKV